MLIFAALIQTTMQKELRYSGLSAKPSDYASPDGELQTSINLIHEDEAIRPVMPPTTLFSLPAGYTVLYIHNSPAFDYPKYIIKNSSNVVYWLGGNIQEGTDVSASSLTSIHDFGSTTIYEVNSIGNTLLILASDGMHYVLWKNNSYTYLGTHLPELPISFGLQGEMIRGDEFEIDLGYDIRHYMPLPWKYYHTIPLDKRSGITDQVLGKVNAFIAEHSVNDGKFMYPFFVRYAYRLYDGSLTMHSAPILMVCSSDLAPQCFFKSADEEGYSVTLQLASMFHQLDYAVKNNDFITAIQSWSDIVTSVDIFVTKPIYTYDQNGECTEFSEITSTNDCYCVSKLTNQNEALTTIEKYYQKSYFSTLYGRTFSDSLPLTYPSTRLMLPRRDYESIKADISDESQFYLLTSINVSNLTSSRTILPISKDYLQSLVTREAMNDDYDSHDKLIPQKSFAYNSRINLANIKKTFFEGFDAASLFPYTDGYTLIDGSSVENSTTLFSVTVYFFVKQDGKIIIANGGTKGFSNYTPYLYLYHPNRNAYLAVLKRQGAPAHYYRVELKPHPMLNGAYYFGGWNGIAETAPETSEPTPSTDKSAPLPNKLYSSMINNPFYFPASSINTIGTGTILGMSIATMALSANQNGRFPFYIFATDGVWALEVNADATFGPIKNVTRDVLLGDGKSLTQIDTSVIFATDRGIMLVSGYNSQCITDELINDNDITIDSTLATVAGFSGLTIKPFLNFIQGCRMVYDYTHQRIIIFNPATHDVSGTAVATYPYAYIFSLKSKKWGMMTTTLQSALNSYPEAFAVLEGTKPSTEKYHYVANFSKEDTTYMTLPRVVSGLLITRPLKLDEPDVLKTIDTIIQRGDFTKGNVKTVLYGSRDLIHWQLVYSSTDHYLRGFRGTPYKYFRIALITELTKAKSIFGATVQYTPRLTNQPR